MQKTFAPSERKAPIAEQQKTEKGKQSLATTTASKSDFGGDDVFQELSKKIGKVQEDQRRYNLESAKLEAELREKRRELSAILKETQYNDVNNCEINAKIEAEEKNQQQILENLERVKATINKCFDVQKNLTFQFASLERLKQEAGESNAETQDMVESLRRSFEACSVIFLEQLKLLDDEVNKMDKETQESEQDLKSKLTTLQLQLSNEKLETDRVVGALAAMQERNRAEEAKQADLVKKLDNARQTIKSKENAVLKQKLVHEELLEELQKVQDERDTVVHERLSAEAQLKEEEGQLAAVKAKMPDPENNKLKELFQMIDQKQSECDQLATEEASLEIEVQQLRTGLVELMADTNTLSVRVEERSQLFSEHRKAVLEAEKKVADMRDTYEKDKERLLSLESELSAAKVELEKTQLQNQELELKKERNKITRAKQEEISQTLNKKREELDSKKNRLAEQQKECGAANQLFCDLTTELVAIQEKRHAQKENSDKILADRREEHVVKVRELDTMLQQVILDTTTIKTQFAEKKFQANVLDNELAESTENEAGLEKKLEMSVRKYGDHKKYIGNEFLRYKGKTESNLQYQRSRLEEKKTKLTDLQKKKEVAEAELVEAKKQLEETTVAETKTVEKSDKEALVNIKKALTAEIEKTKRRTADVKVDNAVLEVELGSAIELSGASPHKIKKTDKVVNHVPSLNVTPLPNQQQQKQLANKVDESKKRNKDPRKAQSAQSKYGSASADVDISDDSPMFGSVFAVPFSRAPAAPNRQNNAGGVLKSARAASKEAKERMKNLLTEEDEEGSECSTDVKWLF